MDYAKEYDRMVEQSNSQLAELEQLRQRVAELEEQAAENNHHLQVEVESCNHFMEQLAASQLDNLRLRSALENMNAAFVEVPVTIHTSVAIDASYEALSTPTDTEALEKYLADRLKLCAWQNKYLPNSFYTDDNLNPQWRLDDMIPLYKLNEKP